MVQNIQNFQHFDQSRSLIIAIKNDETSITGNPVGVCYSQHLCTRLKTKQKTLKKV